MMNQEEKISSQRKSYSESERIPAGSSEVANQPRKKWGQQQPERKVQYAAKEEDEELANYIETMDKEDLEILKQSLVVNSNSNKKGYYRDNTSPERPLEEVEEDESIKDSNYDDGQEIQQKRHQYYAEEDDEEEEKEIKEEIEESVESHSEVYASKQLKNNRVFSGNPYSQETKILMKPRPISAQVTIGGVANSLYSNGRDNKFKNYDSSKNLGRWEGIGGGDEGERESQLSEIHQKEIEAMRNLNSNPFKIKAKKDVTTKRQENNSHNESEGKIPGKKAKEQAGNLGKGEGLEKLFQKISKLKIGERLELEALIDKIDSGQVSVHALKSLLFEDNGKNAFGNMSSEGSIVASKVRKDQRLDDEDDAIKPETIKFATLRRGQLDGHSITKGLFENTQALSNQLLLSEPNDERSENKKQKGSDDDDNEDEKEEDHVVAFGKNKFKDTMQLKKEKILRNDDAYQQEEQEEKEEERGRRNERKQIGFADDAHIDANYQEKEDVQAEVSASAQGGRNSSANKKTFNLSKKKEKERSLINDIREEKGEVFVIIRVISTWGSPHLAGLTEIKVYDERGINIELKGDNFLIDGGSQNSTRNFSHICDGIYDTTSEDHMWLCTMPCPPRCLEIGIRYKSAYGLGAMKIWNFNKSLIDSVKGIKEIQILRNQTIIHEDTVRQAPGKEHENYAHIIKFKRDIVLDDEKPKPPVHSSRTSLSQNPKESTPQTKKQTSKKSSAQLVLPQPEDKTKNGQKSSCPPTSGNSASSTPSTRQRSKNSRDSITNDESSDYSSLRVNQQLTSNNKNSSNSNNLSTSTASSAQKNQESKIESDVINPKAAVLNGSMSSKGQIIEQPIKEGYSNQNQYSSSSSSTRTENKEETKNVKVSSNASSKKQQSLVLPSSEIVEQQVKSSIKAVSSPVAITKLAEAPLSAKDENNKKGNTSSNINTYSKIKQNTKEIPAVEPAAVGKQEYNDPIARKELQQSNIDKQNDAPNQYTKQQQQLQRLSQDSANSGTNQADSFMEHLKFFNATHKGRFLAADRELLLQTQANDAKEAVEQTLKSINSFLTNANPGGGADRQQKQVFDPKSHFGFDDSDEYKALDVFLDVKKANSKISQDAGDRLNQNNGNISNSVSNKGNTVNSSQKSIIDSHNSKKVILESPILEEMLREEHQLELEAGKNHPSSSQTKLTNEKIFETNPRNEQPKIQTHEEKNNYQNSFLDKELQELLRSQNISPEQLLPNQSHAIMELLKSQGIGNQLNQTDLLLEQLQASFRSNKAKTPSDILSSTFTIPTLPQGQLLRIEILSTWGDSHYVGLSGLEFFDADGKPIVIANPTAQVNAAPKDINELPEYKEDPRTCDKLVDGCYLTCDDLHMWLAPFFAGRRNYIFIDLGKPVQLSMIRIWNYNKSRIHSFRGAKDIAVFLEDKPIFAGQISKAPGSQAYAAEECEYIIFTNKESLLEKIEANDWLSTYELPFIEEEQEMLDQLSRTQQLQRISTGNGYSSELQQSLTALPRSLIGKDGRPLTSAKSIKNITNTDQIDKDLNSKANVAIEKQLKLSQQFVAKKRGVKCRKLRIQILKSYEDKNFVGLTGIELHDDTGSIIRLDKKQLSAKPSDLNDIQGYKGDQRTLDKLIDGVNLTTNETHMWCAQLLPNGQNFLLIDLGEERTISAIKIWNYNKIIQYESSQSLEPYRGAAIISIAADEVNLVTPPQGIQLRKAPGRDLFDYGQTIPLPFDEGWTPEIIESLKLPSSVATNFIQEYDTIYLPKGHCFRLNLHSTWGDAHYIGLNGIEFYDSFGSPIIGSGQIDFKLGAEPASVNVLPGCSGDIRTIDKLVNGQNETFDDRNMWLAPFINQASDKKNTINTALKLNTVFVYFEKPIILSAINFWNYTKTPSRGVREVEIFCDDKLIFRGYLKKAPNEEEFLQNKIPIQSTVIFNRNTIILKKISPVVYNEDKLQQAVLFSNEGKVDDEQRKRALLNPQLTEANNLLVRPNTKVSGMKH